MDLSERARKVQLRLDSGQIVGAADRLGLVGLPATSAAIMDVDKAFKAGKLPASLVLRLEEILQKLAAKVSGNGSYHLRTVNNVIHDQPPDTARALTSPRANGHAFSDEPLSPTGTAADDPEWPPGTFEQTCLKIIRQNLNPLFGAEIIYFDRPVDLKYVPDYYKVIKRENARDLGTVSTKLSTHEYSSPQEFYDDMQLFFSNMILYNGSKAPFGVLAERVRKVFERKWATAPFGSATRTRRSTAGIPASRRELGETPPEKRSMVRASSAKSGGATAPRPARAPKRPQEGGPGGRAAKQQKTAGGTGPMPRARMQQLAQVLGELEGNELNGVLQIIRESADLPDNGEIELDFDTLSQDTLWQLDRYLQSINKGTGQGGTFQLVESDESEEFDSDSDSD